MPLAPLLLALALLPTAACRRAAHGPRPAPVPREIAAGVKLSVVARGLAKPVALAFAPGDARRRLFVVEKIGRIRTLHDGALQDAAAPFLDLRDRVSGASEQGLLGLAFHPRFAANGRFYVNLTDRAGDTRVLEYRVPPGEAEQAEPASERELLFVDQPYANHNGGHLAFGPDGLLYVGLGDGGSAGDPRGNAQSDRTLLGKMVVLDVDAPAPPRIVAKGLRNPWRYAFDRATGDLWIADVGQNRYEEIDVLTAAAVAAVRAGTAAVPNFGWNVVEGLGHCYGSRSCAQAGLAQPLSEYDHDDGCSITGGYVYRGRALPALVGRYFYADYCTALVRSLRWPGAGAAVEDSWDWRPVLDPQARLASLSSFGEDADGELYLLSLDGEIYRLDPAP